MCENDYNTCNCNECKTFKAIKKDTINKFKAIGGKVGKVTNSKTRKQ